MVLNGDLRLLHLFRNFLQANSADLDQMLHSAASDLGLHCLPIFQLSQSRFYR